MQTLSHCGFFVVFQNLRALDVVSDKVGECLFSVVDSLCLLLLQLPPLEPAHHPSGHCRNTTRPRISFFLCLDYSSDRLCEIFVKFLRLPRASAYD